MMNRVSVIIKDLNFMNVYMYQVFLLFHCDRANLEYKTGQISS